MINISQRDKQWGSHKIGKSDLTIADFGCTLTSICMLADYFGEYHNPIDMQQFQDFTPEGLIIWESLKLKKMKFGKRLRTVDHKEIQISLKDPKKACLLEMQLPSGKHWVVATSKIPFVDAYGIVDPWDAKKKTTYAYKNQIVGSAHFYSL